MDEKQISELLECSVCLERLDQTCKVLPCQHTFCRRCLDEILLTHFELRCPECRALVTVPVTDLPTNILVVRILEGLKTKGHREASRLSRGGSRHGSLSTSPSRLGRSSPHKHHDVLRFGSQPCAKALYVYESAEKDDLMFKKGDIIHLRRQVDDNWFHGELNAKTGFFPANFVQVLVPLPQIPQCRTLYDFDLKDENEKDCLSFKKDELLTVIRKVDENWLEGRKGDKIGIFPLTFVELNDAARSLINSKSNLSILPTTTSSSSSCAGVPASSTSSPSHSTPEAVGGAADGQLSIQLPHSPQRAPCSGNQPPHRPPVSIPAEGTSDTASSSLSPPAAAAPAPLPTSSSSSSVPASPHSSPVAARSSEAASLSSSASMSSSQPSPHQQQHQHTQNKRHSLTLSSTAAASLLQPEPGVDDPSSSAPLPATQPEGPCAVHSSAACEDGEVTELKAVAGEATANSTSSCPHGASPHLEAPGSSNPRPKATSPTPNASESNSDTTQAGPLNTPLFIALYNYKPQKEDELELLRGDHYTVAEKCQDGWFKGASVRTTQAGVFPGNYVHIVRHSSAFKPVNPNVLNIRAKAPATSSPATSTTGSEVKSSGQGDTTSSSGAPPLMPRVAKMNNSGRPMASSHVSSSSSSQLRPLPPQQSSSSSSSPHHALWVPNAGSSPGGHPHHSAALMSASANITPPNVTLPQGLLAQPALAAQASSTPSGGTGKDKREKKEKEKKGIAKLLAGKTKKSKPVVTEPEMTVVALEQSAHVRSGSFPISSCGVPDVAVVGGGHRKAASVDSTLVPPVPAKPRPKPPVRERYCCIVPYPPQTEHELLLELGDIIHVHRKREDGWYKGTQERTGKTGLFPASFVDKCD